MLKPSDYAIWEYGKNGKGFVVYLVNKGVKYKYRERDTLEEALISIDAIMYAMVGMSAKEYWKQYCKEEHIEIEGD
jgi:hypothetical protein